MEIEGNMILLALPHQQLKSDRFGMEIKQYVREPLHLMLLKSDRFGMEISFTVPLVLCIFIG